MKNIDSFQIGQKALERKSQKDRTYYDPGIISSPIFVSLCNSRLVYQSIYERENDEAGDRLTELQKKEDNCDR